MTVTRRDLSGLEYLTSATDLLQQARNEHPTAGVWEAADLQWWWRIHRTTDEWEHPFWFDTQGRPRAAAIATQWRRRIALDVLATPSTSFRLIEDAFHAGLDGIHRRASGSSIEVMVDESSAMVGLLESAGFMRRPERGYALWMDAGLRRGSPTTPPPYVLASRPELAGTPHHFTTSVGIDVEARLTEASLYRPELDLCVLDPSGSVAAHGLFWMDPITSVGFVEPLGTHRDHRRRGIARSILTSGLDLLAGCGATRIKVNTSNDNRAACALYRSVGFEPSMTTALYASA